MRARSRRIVREHGPLGLIVVDYLQLMQVSGISENRAVEISEISRSLKSIAKEFNCPVIAGSQLNRSLEQRTDKRPVMSDLRESGAIEQDADVIMAVYRDEVYHEDTPDKGIAEIIILKQRNGPIGRKNWPLLDDLPSSKTWLEITKTFTSEWIRRESCDQSRSSRAQFQSGSRSCASKQSHGGCQS